MNEKFNEEVFKSIAESGNSHKEKFRLIDEAYFALSKEDKEVHGVDIMYYVDLLSARREEDYLRREIKKLIENDYVAFRVLREINKGENGYAKELSLIGDIEYLELRKAVKILLAHKFIEKYFISNQLYYMESPKGRHALYLIEMEEIND